MPLRRRYERMADDATPRGVEPRVESPEVRNNGREPAKLVRLPPGKLAPGAVQHVISALSAEPWLKDADVVFDFRDVTELVGAWSIHLATLVDFARKVRGSVRVRGLHGQPLDVARLYRHSREIRELLGAPDPRLDADVA